MTPPTPGEPRKQLSALRSEDLDADPIAQFGEWWETAESDVPLPDAMTLATVDTAGAPDARMVLLKGFGPGGFRFFTNYESEKGEQIAAHPAAALVIYWRELDRQVRVRGPLEKLADADSDEYFNSRPRESRLGAIASPQSRPIERAELERRFNDAEARHPGEDVPRPSNWGGFVLMPRSIEFWQGRTGRLHDRFRYERGEDGWRLARLAP